MTGRAPCPDVLRIVREVAAVARDARLQDYFGRVDGAPAAAATLLLLIGCGDDDQSSVQNYRHIFDTVSRLLAQTHPTCGGPYPAVLLCVRTHAGAVHSPCSNPRRVSKVVCRISASLLTLMDVDGDEHSIRNGMKSYHFCLTIISKWSLL